MTFLELQLHEPLLRALKASGYTSPTPIQSETIPLILQGRDILGCAQTGTGKTAAFSLPILQALHDNKSRGLNKSNDIQALILSPTRELAIQIAENIKEYAAYTGIKHTVIFGGVSASQQIRELQRKPEILVATPGRLLDLINQKVFSLRHIQFLVLDEADRMLDMGFINDIRKVVALIPKKRQTLLFSATMPTDIANLAQTILYNPAQVEVTPVSSTVDKINQAIYPVAKPDKSKLLVHLLKTQRLPGLLVFSRTKYGADKIVRFLRKANITAEAIHGNKSQNARQNALKSFKAGKINVLVATDIAARGIDVDDLQYVINYDLPNEPETYVHRIGRTGRAGASGTAWSFCDIEEIEYLWQINKLIQQELPLIAEHPYATSLDKYQYVPKSKNAVKKSTKGKINKNRRPHKKQDLTVI